jgi:hypothetical protein
MTPTTLNQADLIGLVIGFFCTLFVFSYLLGDNPLFRIATHLFVGVAAGYAAIITIYNVLLPQLIFPLFFESPQERLLSIVLLVPSIFLFAKITPFRKAGNWVMALLVGIGAAAAVGGAITGTLFPQMLGTINSFEADPPALSQEGLFTLVNAGIIVLGTLTTLIYFHFGVRAKAGRAPERSMLIEKIGQLGQVFISITFGTLFAGVYLAALAALIERLSFLWEFITQIGLDLLAGQ